MERFRLKEVTLVVIYYVVTFMLNFFYVLEKLNIPKSSDHKFFLIEVVRL